MTVDATELATGLVVNEMFGPTFQGEGQSQGRIANFLRLYGCHLSCSWCDTPQTWDRRRHDPYIERRHLGAAEVMDRLRDRPVDLLVVTGGEPLLQQHALAPVLEAIREEGLASEIEVETSGTIAPNLALVDAVTRFTVSPKLANSNLRVHQRIRSEVLRAFVRTDQANWKFVVESVEDLDEVDALVTEFNLPPVWIMPEGSDSVTVLDRMRVLADPVLARGWHLTSRLHVLLWENARAR